MSTHQILIASYAKDFPFLKPLLMSLRKFCVGFLPPVICTTKADAQLAREICAQVYPEATVSEKEANGWGYLRAQIAMMCGDLICPQADFTYLVGSDCLVTAEMRPDMYFQDGKPVMMFHSYAHLNAFHWQPGTERALKMRVANEFMRRLPLLYPRELFPLVRSHIEKIHGVNFEDYVYSTVKTGNGFSESNVMGAYAFAYAPHLYKFVTTDRNNHDAIMAKLPSPLVQWWSHGGLDTPAGGCCAYGDGKTTHNRTPREVMKEILGEF